MNVRIAFDFGGVRFAHAGSSIETLHKPGGFPTRAELHRYVAEGHEIHMTAQSVCAHVDRGEFTNVTELDGEPHGCGCGCGESSSTEQSPGESEPAPETPPAPPKRRSKSRL